MTWKYEIQFHGWHAAFTTMAETVVFLDQWRTRDPWHRVTAYSYVPTDEDDDGLNDLERECIGARPGAVRDEMVREIDGKEKAA